MGVPPGNRPAVPRDWFRGVPERHVAGADTRGRQEGRPYPWSQQVIHEISGLTFYSNKYEDRIPNVLEKVRNVNPFRTRSFRMKTS